MSAKGCVGYFLFHLNPELFAKLKRPGFYTHVFFNIFINNSRSKQKKKNPEQSFLGIII